MKRFLSCLLTLPLLFTLVSCFPKGNTAGLIFYSYDDPSEYTEGPVPSSLSFDSLFIEWVAGSVVLGASEDGAVSLTESGQEDLPLYYRLKDGELTVRFCASGSRYEAPPEKTLTVSLPASLLSSLRIETVSASVRSVGVSASAGIRVSSVSGRVHFSGAQTARFECETVSGSVSAEGSFGDVVLNTVSGGCELMLPTPAGRVTAGSVSGDLTFFFPEDGTAGYTLRSFDTVSGTLDGEKTSGEGKTVLECETISGNLLIGTYQ